MPSVTRTITADNTTSQENPNDNFGTAINVQIRGDSPNVLRAYMEFGGGGPNPPLGSTINTATINFEVIDKNPSGSLEMKTVSSGDFDELTQTFNNIQITWGDPSSLLPVPAVGEYTLDCKEAVQGWSDAGLADMTFAFIKAVNNAIVKVDSENGAGIDASITIDYTPPAAGGGRRGAWRGQDRGQNRGGQL